MDEQLKQYIIGILESGKDSLVTLERGGIIEQVDRAIGLVLQNICDINTTMGVREITLKLKAKPLDESRTAVAWQFEVPHPKLSGQTPMGGVSEINIDANGKGFYSKQRHRQQLEMFDQGAGGNVKKLGGREE